MDFRASKKVSFGGKVHYQFLGDNLEKRWKEGMGAPAQQEQVPQSTPPPLNAAVWGWNSFHCVETWLCGIELFSPDIPKTIFMYLFILVSGLGIEPHPPKQLYSHRCCGKEEWGTRVKSHTPTWFWDYWLPGWDKTVYNSLSVFNFWIKTRVRNAHFWCPCPNTTWNVSPVCNTFEEQKLHFV